MKNILWILVAVVVLVGGWFIIPKKESGNNVTNSTATTTGSQTVSGTNKTPTTVVKQTLGNVLSVKGSYECNYEGVSQTERTTNVVYFSDGKMRAEFRTKFSSGLGTTNMMVYDGLYLYVWVEGQTVGVRTQPKTVADLPSIIPLDVKSGKVLGSGLNSISWDCHAWSKVPSLLAKPSYVRFN